MNDTQIPLGDHADSKGTAAMVKNLRSIRLFLVEGSTKRKENMMSRKRCIICQCLIISFIAITLLPNVSHGAKLQIHSRHGHNLYDNKEVNKEVCPLLIKVNDVETEIVFNEDIFEREFTDNALIRITVPYRIFTRIKGDKEYFYQKLMDKDGKEAEEPLSSYEWPYYPRIRYTCTGFDISDSAISGNSCEYTFTITKDTHININWQVDYALDVVSLVDQATQDDPLLQDDELRMLGNPLYNVDNMSSANLIVGAARPYENEKKWEWGRVWIPQGKTVEIDIGRTGFQPELPKIDERYVVHRFDGQGSVPSSKEDFETSPTFSISSFVMDEPSKLVLRWKKQVRIKLGPILKDEARDYPFVDIIHGFKGGPNQLCTLDVGNIVNVVAITPDRKYAIYGDSNNLIVMDIQSRNRIHELEGHENSVTAVAVTSDGKTAVSCSSDEQQLYVWDIDSNTCTTLQENSEVNDVAITPDGQYIISALDYKTLSVWELQSDSNNKYKITKPLKGIGKFKKVSVTSDGKTAVSSCSSDKQQLYVWDIDSNTCTTLKENSEVKDVAITPDGQYIISALDDKTLSVWELQSDSNNNYKKREESLKGHTGIINAVVVTYDGKYAISASEDKTLMVWTIQTGELLHPLEGHEEAVRDVAITPDGGYVISGSVDETIKVWYEAFIQKQEDWYHPYSGLGHHDMPERWFDCGINLFIGTAYQPGEGIKLKGWHTAGGHFTLPQGHIPSALLTERDDVELHVNGETKTIPGGISYGLEIPFLERPTVVTWDYGDMIFKFDVPIGDCLDPKLLNLSAQEEEGELITDWEGNEVNRDNMPSDINLDIEPTFTIIEGAPPGSSPQNTMAWDEVGKRLLPLRPGRYQVEFKAKKEGQSVFVELASGFFGEEIPNSAQQEALEAREADTDGTNGTKTKEQEEMRDIFWLGSKRQQKVKVLKDNERDQVIGILARYLPELGDDWKQNYKKANYRHIAGAPVVSLDPDVNDKFHFLELVYFEADTYDEGEYPKVQAGKAAVSEGRFTNGIAGRSVLLFSQSDPKNPASFPATGDRTQEMLFARVVETRDAEMAKDWNDPNKDMMESDPNTKTIGTPLSSDYDRTDLKTGWLYQTDPNVVGKQLYDPDIYDQENVEGPIIPVNRRLQEWSKDKGYRDEIVVVWYENLRKETDKGKRNENEDIEKDPNVMDEPNINWPWKPVHYPSDELIWPHDPGQIVMASRLGSAGLDSNGDSQLEFLSPRYTDVRIYHQPDRDKPGYNPNEEHAIIADSIFKHELDEDGNHPIIVTRDDASPPPAAFAFRNDLNIISNGNYTSEPYVLVEYFDTNQRQHGIKVYKIEYENAIYKFSYEVKVGEPIDAPYPLNKVIGLSNMNDSHLGTKFTDNEPKIPVIDGTYFRNGAENGKKQATYWIDSSGVAWAISGPTDYMLEPHLFGHFYYPLPPSFWHPADKTGTKQVWLPGLKTSNGPPDKIKDSGNEINGPGKVRFNTAWPKNLPILKIGETLMYAGGEYREDNPITEPEGGKRADTPGLPGVIGWKAGQVLFDSRNPTMEDDWTDPSNFTARLLNPLIKIEVSLKFEDMKKVEQFNPTSEAISLDGLLWRFTQLPASLQKRIYYDPQGQTESNGNFITGKLGLRGYVSDRTLGDSNLTADPDPVFMLESNILTSRDKGILEKLFENSTAWKGAVNDLYKRSRDPYHLDTSDETPYLVGLYSEKKLDEDLKELNEDRKKKGLPEVNPIYQDSNGRVQAASFGPGLALVPNPAIMDPANKFKEGYITLVENTHPTKPDLSPVTIHIVKLEKKHRYRGNIKTLLSPNVFDEKAMLSHTGDFGGNVDDLAFDWWYRPAASDVAEHPLPTEQGAEWQRLDPDDELPNQVVLEGNPSLLLGDNLFFVRYRHKNEDANFPEFNSKEDVTDNNFPWEWAGAGNSPQIQADGSKKYLPQLMMGWVKRVLDAVNPYEARFSKFHDHESPATYASMIQQAGGPYVGPVALNPDKDVIENVGLIQLYQTLLKRARELSIDLDTSATDESIQMALLLAATRVSDLYMLLGNEAYADAQDPTIGVGTEATEYGKLAPALFAFQNQEASLLHEELALLRGTDFSKGNPVQNRLFWNFFKGQGEAAYATNYNIKDITGKDGKPDGFINEYDAKLLYPQGHGDAWGHYLSASKAHYTLLQHPQFHWYTQAELYNLMDIVLNVDFLDEVKFARTAAARAQAGAEIVNLTYRLAYAEKPKERWQGLHDQKEGRYWGVSEWAKRTGQAALFDWAVANALLPYEAKDEKNKDKDKENLNKIDRLSVHDIRVISANHGIIQSKLDEANNGLNPLGLVNEAVAFDIDPVRVDRNSAAPATHFEQIYERSVKAAQNAVAVLDYANSIDKRLRQVEERVDQFYKQALEQDLAYRNRLIEIFGLPYEGTIGPGQIYPEGYIGPDTMLYFYVDQAKVLAKYLPQIDKDANTNFINAYTQFVNYYNDIKDDLKDPAGKFPLGEGDYEDGSGKKDANKHPSDRFNSLFDEPSIVPLKLPFIQKPQAVFPAPPEWGKRKAIGRLQEIYGRLMLSELEYKRKLGEYSGYISSLAGTKDGLVHVKEENDHVLDLAKKQLTDNFLLEISKVTFEILADTLKVSTEETVGLTFDSVQISLPNEIGLANDLSAPIEGSINVAKETVKGISKGTQNTFKVIAKGIPIIQQSLKMAREVEMQNAVRRKEMWAAVQAASSKFKDELNLRLDIYEKLKEMEQLGNLYLTNLQEGMRLLDERYAYNKRLASGTQQNRYQDMTFRVMRNDALQKYRSTFDLAARYVYLAAMAYDYETNLDPDHRASAQGLLDDIVRTRTLGQWIDGEPRMGYGGLAEILAKLKDNFEVLNGQLGFNNPQTETGRLSLRRELFRLGDNKKEWREKLKGYKVDDLWQMQEFRLHCRPFASPGEKQPGIVIPFETEITEGKNFFGKDVKGMDNVYDSSQYATKIRSVGVWFVDYPNTDLVQTPRVYLIPVGTDIMRIPDSPTLEQRRWNVLDQRIPVPHKIGFSDLEDQNWIPALDSVSGSFADMRKFSRFRAYHDGGSKAFDDSEMTWDSRLVGRSVWNTNWLLIIPGSTLHVDPENGLQTFIGTDNKPGISDIQLLFQTYSHSGN